MHSSASKDGKSHMLNRKPLFLPQELIKCPLSVQVDKDKFIYKKNAHLIYPFAILLLLTHEAKAAGLPPLSPVSGLGK